MTILNWALFLLPLTLFAKCPFCDPEVLKEQTFYEDEYALGVYPHKPMFQGHCLVIPKRHITKFSDLTVVEMEHLFELLRKIDVIIQNEFQTQEYMILQKNGKSVGQTVPHIHFHYIPRKKGDNPYTLLFHFLIHPFQSPLQADEIKNVVSKLKKLFFHLDSPYQ